MKALVVQEFGQSPIYMDIADPIAGPDEVMIAVKAAAVSQVARAGPRAAITARQFRFHSSLGSTALACSMTAAEFTLSCPALPSAAWLKGPSSLRHTAWLYRPNLMT